MPRVDLPTAIHNRVRALIYEVGRDLRPLDAGGATGARTLDRLDRASGMLEEPHPHEERSNFPHVRAFGPEMIAEFEAQYEEATVLPASQATSPIPSRQRCSGRSWARSLSSATPTGCASCSAR